MFLVNEPSVHAIARPRFYVLQPSRSQWRELLFRRLNNGQIP